MIQAVTPAAEAATHFIVTVVAKGRTSIQRSFGAGVQVTVGRSTDSDICLPVPNVSRKHCIVELTPLGFAVCDCSTAGTRLGDELLLKRARVVDQPRVSLRVGGYWVHCEKQCSGGVDALPASAQVVAALPAGEEGGGEPAGRALRLSDKSPRGMPLESLRSGEAAGHERAVDGGRAVDPGPRDPRRRIHQRLLERLDLARKPQSQKGSDQVRREVRAVLGDLVREAGVPAAEQARLVEEIADEALGFGPLEALLKDERVSEIMVVEPKVIYVEMDGRLVLSGRSFSDADALRATIERIVTPLGRRIDESSPMVDARLADGSRVNAVIPPLALRGPCITIRKFRIGSLSFDQLVDRGSLSEAMARFLSDAVRVRKNIVIAGGTGSGKTTLLNLLSGKIPAEERIVTIEDAAELRLQQEHVVALESRPPNLEGRGEVAIRDLVKNALRMRPDRIIVGECRGGEALDMLQAMNTGHEGSMTTTHANSPREAIHRLETLCLMSAVDLPIAAIRRQIASSLHLIIQQARLSDGSRKVTAIAEVLGIDEDGEIATRTLFEHLTLGRDSTGMLRGRFVSTGYLPTFYEQLRPLQSVGEEVS